MILVESNQKHKCCGCAACMNICPNNAIEMRADYEGFLYPIINKSKCIECGLCKRTCPIINKQIREDFDIEAYAIRCKNKNVLKDSTSGGFFLPASEYVIDHNGVVFGVGFDKDNFICHKEAHNIEGVHEFIGSKYVQSYLGDTYTKIREYLLQDVLVLFSGTPCQVEGLYKFLGKKYDNLITVDVICHGVPSPELWKKYIEYQEKKYNSKIREVRFRNKTYGYHSRDYEINL